ncbi:MAG: division/cell wall cluster transcriptional repressor MraZ [Acidimicrobiia bacterium]
MGLCGGPRRTDADRVFLGEYQHSVDEKGRLVLPIKFRDRLSKGLVITKGQERCVFVFPQDRWDEEVEKVNRLPRTNRRNRNYARTFFAAASDQKADRQGRIQIPAGLRSYADLGKEVVVVGVADRIEIWNTEAWQQVSEEGDQLYSEIEEALSEEGI